MEIRIITAGKLVVEIRMQSDHFHDQSQAEELANSIASDLMMALGKGHGLQISTINVTATKGPDKCPTS